MFKSAVAHSEDVIFYFDLLGNKYVAQGGSLTWRLNNPGLVRSHSHFARKHGSIGSCNGFAIFSSSKQARKALIDLLRTKKYSNSTLKTIAQLYQAKDLDAYISRLASLTSVALQKKISSFSSEEFHRLIVGIEKSCGYLPIGNENLRTLAMKRYIGLKEGLNQEQILSGLAQEDTILYLDTTDVNVIQNFENQRKKYYQEQIKIIENVTILDPDLGCEHSFCIDCYQKVIQSIIQKYKTPPISLSSERVLSFATV